MASLFRYIFKFLLLCLILCSCTGEKKGHERKEYFPNGKLKSSAEVMFGKRNGKFTEYHESGYVKYECIYKNDIPNGLCTFYDSMGLKVNEGTYENGLKVGEWIILGDNETVRQITYYNKGQIMYFEKFEPSGRRSLDPIDSQILVISENDSIEFGQRYEFLIALGNKRPGVALKFFLDSLPKNVLESKFALQTIDSVTAKSYIYPKTVGFNSFLGFAVEIRYNNQDSILVFPFKHTFFAKAKTG